MNAEHRVGGGKPIPAMTLSRLSAILELHHQRARFSPFTSRVESYIASDHLERVGVQVGDKNRDVMQVGGVGVPEKSRDNPMHRLQDCD
jgi:hypothetical protein